MESLCAERFAGYPQPGTADSAGAGHKQTVGREYGFIKTDVCKRGILRHPADVRDIHECPA